MRDLLNMLLRRPTSAIIKSSQLVLRADGRPTSMGIPNEYV